MTNQNSHFCPNGDLRTDQAGRCGNTSLFQLCLPGTLWSELPVRQDVLLLKRPRIIHFA